MFGQKARVSSFEQFQKESRSQLPTPPTALGLLPHLPSAGVFTGRTLPSKTGYLPQGLMELSELREAR